MQWNLGEKAVLASAALIALGTVAGGYLLGDGLKRAKAADRSVTVRGLAEKDVTADLATWSISYSATGFDLPTVRSEIDANSRELRAYFEGLGFKPEELKPTGAGVNQWLNNGVSTITVTQRMLLRTTDIARAQKAVAQQFDLVRRGVTLQEGSNSSRRIQVQGSVGSRAPRRAISRSTPATEKAEKAAATRLTRRYASSPRSISTCDSLRLLATGRALWRKA